MNSSTRKLLLVAALAIVLSVSLLDHVASAPPKPPAPPPVTYTLTFLDANLRLEKMNESGVAVGYTAGDAPLAKVRLADGTLIDLTSFVQAEIPNCPWLLLERAWEINASGQIAGVGLLAKNGVPIRSLFRFSPAEGVDPACIELLTTLQPSVIYLGGMNDAGDVVLRQEKAGSPDTAWVVSGLPGEAVATQLPMSGVGSVPLAINNLGQVTGQLDDGSLLKAFRFTPATASIELFGTITGSPATDSWQSGGNDINDLGVIAGFAYKGRPTRGKEDSSPWAVRLIASGVWETVAGGGSSNASALNNSGVTVGTRTGVYGQGFVFLSGKMYALKDLMLSPPANLAILLPNDITNGGQICGEAAIKNPDGTYQFGGGFILTPVAP